MQKPLSIKEVSKLEMEVVLRSVTNQLIPEIYKNTLQTLYSSFSLLKEASVKSKTKIDDCIIDIVLGPVEETAAKAGIVLS